MLAMTADGASGRSDEVICVRTNQYDEHLDRFIDETLIPTGRRVVLLADEGLGPVLAPGHREKIVLNPAEQGLHMGADTMWRCGDYCLYAAIAALPDASHIWLIEPDVRIHGNAPTALFDGVASSRPRADFVTAWFVTASPEWSWYNTITPFFPTTCNCMLQLARFSRPFIQALFEARVALSQRFAAEGRASSTWPNDEAFIGAVAHSQQFRVETLAQHAPGFSTEATFTFLRPTSGTFLNTAPRDNRIYHPVLFGQSFINRARHYLNDRIEGCRSAGELIRDLPSPFLQQVMAEIGSEAGLAFYEDVKLGANRVAKRAAAGA